MKLVGHDYVYDRTAAAPNEQDHSVASALHEVIQEVRKQLSAEDDTPGKLTAEEILTIAFQKVPGAAITVVNAIKDGFTFLDGESIGHCLLHNLVDDEPELG